MGPPRRDHLPGPGWLRHLRRDRTGPEQHRDRIAPPRSRATRLRRRAPVPVPGPGRATGIRGIPPSAIEVVHHPGHSCLAVAIVSPRPRTTCDTRYMKEVTAADRASLDDLDRQWGHLYVIGV